MSMNKYPSIFSGQMEAMRLCIPREVLHNYFIPSTECTVLNMINVAQDGKVGCNTVKYNLIHLAVFLKG